MSAGTRTNGRTYTTRGVNERNLREGARKKHSDLDPQGLLNEAVMRRFIDANMCPYCPRGPFVNLAMHTSKAHGIDRREIRAAAGLSLTQPVASPEHRARCAKSAKSVGFGASLNPSEMGRRGAHAPKQVSDAARARMAESNWLATLSPEEKAEFYARRSRNATAESKKRAVVKRNETIAVIVGVKHETILTDWLSTSASLQDLVELAAKHEKTPSAMRRYLRRIGATDLPDGRTVVLTHCKKRGHELTPANTISKAYGRRACRECARIAANERYKAGKK